MRTILPTICVLLTGFHVQASLIANDNAANAPYGDGWSIPDNGGSGFLPWENINNANGLTGFGGGYISTGNIAVDIGTGVGNAAFGVFGNGGGTGQATRPFTGDLGLSQTFSIDMDNQGIDDFGTVGFSLRNSSSQDRFEFYFVGGQANYTINAGSIVDTGVGYTTGGLNLAFTLTGADAFSFTINGGTPITGTLKGTGGSGIDRVRIFNANGGPDVFYNNLSIVPEPASGSLLGLGLMLFAALRRR